MTNFSVRHSTVDRYLKPVTFGEHRLMFRPRDSFDQRLLEATLIVEPGPSQIRWIHDVFGNCVAIVQIAEPAMELHFQSHIRLEHTPHVALDLQHVPGFCSADDGSARSLGLAARFVTGYIYVPSREGSITRGGGSTHAWCQIYLPGAGWVEFDPTNGIVGNRDLIRVAVARDPRQAIPLTGSYDGRPSDYEGMSVQVNVTTETAATFPAIDV